ncbi:MAG TPA: HIT family protein [Methylophilaceae bacterium]|nr:HIT family protein [Methylophilaceae bacterium]HQR60398.1 HIT family protein [Methylophilaceae bacterium]
MACELCANLGGELIWQNDFCRVALVDDTFYPGFCRVILNRHIKEMTELDEGERSRLMAVVFAVESAVRDVLKPDKINLASLGNVVPHLHWHVIPRFADDRHFPNPIWGEPKRDGQSHPLDRQGLIQAIRSRL